IVGSAPKELRQSCSLSTTTPSRPGASSYRGREPETDTVGERTSDDEPAPDRSDLKPTPSAPTVPRRGASSVPPEAGDGLRSVGISLPFGAKHAGPRFLKAASRLGRHAAPVRRTRATVAKPARGSAAWLKCRLARAAGSARPAPRR